MIDIRDIYLDQQPTLQMVRNYNDDDDDDDADADGRLNVKQ